VIGFGLRLTLRGGREAWARLLVTALAVALGVGLLVVTLAAVNGVDAQNSRYAWLNSGTPGASPADAKRAEDPLWAKLATEYHDGAAITRVDVAATGPTSPVPPGIARLPGAGEYFASPAFERLLRATPGDELGDRYPVRRAGTIGAVALPSPDSLIVIVGHPEAELASVPGATRIFTIGTELPSECVDCRVGTSGSGMGLILSVTAAALLFPVLVFIGTATRLSAARREQRFAAMRLVGATPRQVAAVSAVESTVAAVVGTAVGFALFALLRTDLAQLPFTGAPLQPGDLALGVRDVLVVALGVPVAAAVAARVALRRVRISPLGVARRVTPRPPRAIRLLPLVVGIAELMYFVGRRPRSTDGQIQAYLGGILLMMTGLVIAGPWLTMVGARVMARRANRPATLIAGRRLADNPKAGFRAISGLVLALFVTTTAVGVITTFVAERGTSENNPAGAGIVVADFSRGWGETPGEPRAWIGPVPQSRSADLRAIEGVRGVAVVHTNPVRTEIAADGGRPVVGGLVECRELADLPALGHCAAGAQTAAFATSVVYDVAGRPSSDTTWPAGGMDAGRVAGLPTQMVVVDTDGSRAAVERVKTALTVAFPGQDPPSTAVEHRDFAETAQLLVGYRQLANVVVIASLCVAGCGLAVSVVAGLNDRRRPFGLLRLSGVQLGTLRRVVALESAVPLLVVSVVAIGMGFLAAALFLRSQMDYALHVPGAGYWLTTGGGLLASLGVIACTLPLLARLTSPATARNE